MASDTNRPRLLTVKGARKLLKAKIRAFAYEEEYQSKDDNGKPCTKTRVRTGSLRGWAKAHDVDAGYTSRARKGEDKDFGPLIAKAIGLIPVTMYRRLDTKQDK